MENNIMETVSAPAFDKLGKLPALLTVWRLSHAGWGLVLGLLGGYAIRYCSIELEMTPVSPLAGVLLPACVCGAFGWFYAGRRFALYQGGMREGEGVVLNRGVWWRSEVWVPIARLQHIDVSQGPLDRRWGMARLTLHTAGTHDHASSIDGLPVEQAHALRAALLPRTRGLHD